MRSTTRSVGTRPGTPRAPQRRRRRAPSAAESRLKRLTGIARAFDAKFRSAGPLSSDAAMRLVVAAVDESTRMSRERRGAPPGAPAPRVT